MNEGTRQGISLLPTLPYNWRTMKNSCSRVLGIFMLLVLPILSSQAAIGGGDDPLFKLDVGDSFAEKLELVVTTFDQQTVNIKLFNEGGEVVFKYTVPLYGELTQEINTKAYPSGSYKLVVLVGGEEKARQVVKA